MNIFILSIDPYEAARYHMDKHVVKMPLESAQLLSGAHHYYESDITSLIYRPTHMNHPCAIWVRESTANYEWLYNLYKALLIEFSYRYGNHHGCNKLLPYLKDNPCVTGRISPFAQAMPDKYKTSYAVAAYREYYLGEKRKFASWKNTETPFWWI